MRPHPLRKKLLGSAARDLRFLLSRGYPRKSAIIFIGNHYQLHQGERDFLYRGVFTPEQCASRRRKKVKVGDLTGERVVIDGHNVLITLESAIRGRPLLLADDGFVRDISRVFRRFRPSERTRAAWRFVERIFLDYPPGHVTVLLDAPLPRSRELAARIRDWMVTAGMHGDAEAVARPETTLLAEDGIKATADSAIIDRSGRVFDMAGHIIMRRMHIRPVRIP
ncbi:MAG TPA: DUF434 domain-containing protein [Thermodesulfobacteriaceae bacterium]|nr:DUF434 domain-containing protein [Thermodesulfobacteriaceae bacterium]